ncbi:hypothetical protein EVAR_11004_1 [Eumeta japonica]|uniref:Uncharacterized protein n=1 Tax=Eumeta variegata TaxID=151549 RepID=A0A4C1YLY2_EUMVA|nr:hypothetical protein EVAR_11004_1 [Eumeta japonica]
MVITFSLKCQPGAVTAPRRVRDRNRDRVRERNENCASSSTGPPPPSRVPRLIYHDFVTFFPRSDAYRCLVKESSCDVYRTTSECAGRLAAGPRRYDLKLSFWNTRFDVFTEEQY